MSESVTKKTAQPKLSPPPQKLAELAAEVGAMMIAYGAEAQRAEDAITRILATSGYTVTDAFVLTTGITVTLSDEDATLVSITRRIRPGGCNMGHVCDANSISRNFCEGKISVEEALSRLRCAKERRIYHYGGSLVGSMLVCGGFAYMFGGSVLDALAALLCGAVWWVAYAILTPLIRRSFVSDMLSCFIMASFALLLTYLGNRFFNLGLQSHYMIVGGMMPLVPGVSITTAIRDILGGDYISSLSRAVSAFLTAASVAIGVGLAITLGNVLDFSFVAPDFAFLGTEVRDVRILFEAVAAFVSAWGFCALLEVPKKLRFSASITAVVCWMIYLAAGILTISTAWATTLASAAVYLMAYFLARREKAPVLVFLIGGILPLVPGFAIYRSVYYMIIGDALASASLAQTFTVAGTIALGIFLADTANEMLLRRRREKRAKEQATSAKNPPKQ